MKYQDYTASDFASDTFFIQWVKRPDDESEWFWNSFSAEHPDCRQEIQKARKIVTSLSFPEDPMGEDELLSMRQRLLLSLRVEKQEVSEQLTRRIPRKTYPWLKIAASVMIIALVCFNGHIFTNKATDAIAWSSQHDSRGFEERVNPSGQKSVLFLSDGTKVWLNAASKLSYRNDFGSGSTREVHLEGEAFFDVAHNADKPFIVHTSSIRIKVLGTSFNVKSYPEEKTIETTLVKGKVRIEGGDSKTNGIGDVELKPNQRAVFHKESKTINISEVDASNSGAWKQDRMVFHGETMDNVILQLERSYDVRIHVADKGSLTCKLTASIEKESLDEILELLKASHNIRYSIEGKDVFIEGRLCKMDKPDE
jgi:ferric-dicitrate binding protein FerR (iron transport regulator)